MDYPPLVCRCRPRVDRRARVLRECLCTAAHCCAWRRRCCSRACCRPGATRARARWSPGARADGPAAVARVCAQRPSASADRRRARRPADRLLAGGPPAAALRAHRLVAPRRAARATAGNARRCSRAPPRKPSRSHAATDAARRPHATFARSPAPATKIDTPSTPREARRRRCWPPASARCGCAPAALAHAQLVATSPQSGATLASAAGARGLRVQRGSRRVARRGARVRRAAAQRSTTCTSNTRTATRTRSASG